MQMQKDTIVMDNSMLELYGDIFWNSVKKDMMTKPITGCKDLVGFMFDEFESNLNSENNAYNEGAIVTAEYTKWYHATINKVNPLLIDEINTLFTDISEKEIDSIFSEKNLFDEKNKSKAIYAQNLVLFAYYKELGYLGSIHKYFVNNRKEMVKQLDSIAHMPEWYRFFLLKNILFCVELLRFRFYAYPLKDCRFSILDWFDWFDIFTFRILPNMYFDICKNLCGNNCGFTEKDIYNDIRNLLTRREDFISSLYGVKDREVRKDLERIRKVNIPEGEATSLEGISDKVTDNDWLIFEQLLERYRGLIEGKPKEQLVQVQRLIVKRRELSIKKKKDFPNLSSAITEEIDRKYVEYLQRCRTEINKQGNTMDKLLISKTIVGETEKLSMQYKDAMFRDMFSYSYEEYLQYLRMKLEVIIERYKEPEKRKLKMDFLVRDIVDIDLAEHIILATEKMDILVPVDIFEQIYFRNKYRERRANEFIDRVWKSFDDYTACCLHDFRTSYISLLQCSVLNRVADFVSSEHLSEEEQRYVKCLARDGESIIKDIHDCTKENF